MGEKVRGLTPEAWEQKLDDAANDPRALAAVLTELDQEMRQEKTWLHEAPPAPIIKTILKFFGNNDEDLERLGQEIATELEHERSLKRRYRSWLPGEDYVQRLYPYFKGFNGEVRPTTEGLQFPGFTRYEGRVEGHLTEAMALFLNERFPGRDPASFHVAFEHSTGCVTIERAFKKELKRIPGISTVGRAVLAELIHNVVPDLTAIRKINGDNATNQETRKLLLEKKRRGLEVYFVPRPDADISATPLGHLVVELVRELGLKPGELQMEIHAYGVLEIAMDFTKP
jgi:hypothetical protein